jgi:Tetratricopeptide repeat/NB-ARC domain
MPRMSKRFLIGSLILTVVAAGTLIWFFWAQPLGAATAWATLIQTFVGLLAIPGLAAAIVAVVPGDRGRSPQQEYPSVPPNLPLPDQLDKHQFVDRATELDLCRKGLLDSGFLVIHGTAGQGKKTLARAYATKYKADYSVIRKINSSHESAIQQSLDELAIALHLTTAPEQSLSERLYLLQNKLRKWNRWLLLFEEVNDWNLIQEFARGLNGHIIATTQMPSGSQSVRTPIPNYLELRSLPPAAASEYLAEHLNIDKSDQAARTEAARWAQKLNYQPYALELAVRTWAIGGMPRSEIFPGVDGAHEALLEEPIRRLRGESELAYSLLQYCALFASDPIPSVVLTMPAVTGGSQNGLRAALADPRECEELLDTIRKYSLIEKTSFTGGGFQVSVQIPLRGYLQGDLDGRLPELISIAMDSLLFAFRRSWYAENFQRCAASLPHAEKWLETAEREAVAPAEASRLMGRIAHYHRLRGELQKARAFHERALGLRERAFGARSLHVARTLNDLGMVLNDLTLYSDAVQTHRLSLEIEESATPPDQQSVAICLDNLGLAQSADGDYAGAVKSHVRAYGYWKSVKTEVPGKEHSGVAQALDNIGRTLYLVGELALSEKMLVRAVGIGTDALCEGFSEMALAGMWHNLGQVLRARATVDDASQALVILRDALATREKEHGANYPSVAETRTDLVRVLVCLGDFTLAERELSEVRRIVDLLGQAEALGPVMPGLVPLSWRYDCAALVAEGEFFFATGRHAEARERLERADGVVRSGLAIPRVQYADLLENLGRASNAGSSESGMRFLSPAAEIRRQLDTEKAEIANILRKARLWKL